MTRVALLNAAEILPCGFDAFLLVDSSGSIGKLFFDNIVKPFAHLLVEEINHRYLIDGGNTRLALLSFSRLATINLQLADGTSVKAIHDEIDSLVFQGSFTHIVQYSRLASDALRLGREGVPKKLILLTDGAPVANTDTNQDENIDNLVQLIIEIGNEADPIETSVIGFKGLETDMEELLKNLRQFRDANALVTSHLDLGDGAAVAAADKLGQTCPSKFFV